MCTRIMERMTMPLRASNQTRRFCVDMSHIFFFNTSFSMPPHRAAMSEKEE